MKKKYSKMTVTELLTGIYTDEKFRIDYFKWLRMGGFPQHKRDVNTTVVNYENYVYDKLNSNWFGRLQYEDIDLVNYSGHKKQIKAFITKTN